MKPTLPQEAFLFLNELKNNNKREWFLEQKPRFKAIEQEVKVFSQELMHALQATDEVDKVKLFRIYRDVRFSKDKTPYKTHFGFSYHRKKPALRGGYYVHIEPGASLIATGFWNPVKEDLLRIRQELALDASDFRKIISAKPFASTWGALKGEEVKTSPKGFSKDEEAIDLIRKKQFIFTRNFSDDQVMAPDFMETILQSFKAVRPYFDYMSEVLTTDLNGVSLLEVE